MKNLLLFLREAVGDPNLWDHLDLKTRKAVADAAKNPSLAKKKWDDMSAKEKKSLKKVWDRAVGE